MKLKNEKLKTVKEECINRIRSLFRCKETANFTDIAGLGLSVDNVALLQLPGSERYRALKPEAYQVILLCSSKIHTFV